MQSVRAVIEQTIADLKLAKVMNGNKISLIARLEKVLDCVIALHNLRVLLKANKAFDIPARRAPVLGARLQTADSGGTGGSQNSGQEA